MTFEYALRDLHTITDSRAKTYEVRNSLRVKY